jgi:multidrug efflux pump subunit AcrA (membrane-fusion protein)
MSPDALVAALGAPDVSGGVCVLAADDAVCCDASLYYRIPAGMSAPDLARVVASAAAPRTTALAPVATETAAWCSKIIFDICASVGLHVQPESAAAMLEDGLARLLPGARFACMFYDAQSGQLWRPCAEVELEAAASHGIVGFVARTGHAVHAPVAGRDPRYVREVDDPRGCGNEALLAVPAGAGAEIHAVLVVVRDPAQGAFDQKACDTLVQLASQVGPVLHRVAMASEVQQALDVLRRPNAMQIFRPEAIEAHQERKETGEVIRVSPAWARWMYWTIIGAITAVAIGSAVAEVSQYSTGAAVVRQDGRSELGAAGSGAVKRIEVEPGDVVERGQVLVRLSDVTERAAFDSTRDDFHAQLRTRLLDPTDEAAAQQLRALRRQLDAAQAELEHRVIRAPHDGIVTDIAVDVGQHVAAGDVVLAVVDEDAPGLEVIAFLPGEDRPQIELGMNLRLELSGFDYAYQDLQVESVSEGVVGGNEAKRIVGPQLADTLPLGGGVVMVRATLPAPTFESDGQTYPYHDGMAGTAEVRLRDETILEMLVPALKEL